MKQSATERTLDILEFLVGHPAGLQLADISERLGKARAAEVPAQVKDDIAFAVEQVRTFALAQKDSVKDFSMVMPSGLTVGQK